MRHAHTHTHTHTINTACHRYEEQQARRTELRAFLKTVHRGVITASKGVCVCVCVCGCVSLYAWLCVYVCVVVCVNVCLCIEA